MKKFDSFLEKHIIVVLIFQILTIVSAIIIVINFDFEDLVRFNNRLVDAIVNSILNDY